MTNAIRILGLDPGLRRTGWGIIAVDGARFSHIGHGVIRPSETAPFAERLMALYDGVADLVAAHRPDEAAIEETFVTANGSSTLKLGHARAAAMLGAAKAGLPVAEYAATVVKKAVVGTGGADKTQVAFMVRRILPACGDASADAADALAIAICHANTRRLRRLGERGVIGRLRGVLAEAGEEDALIDVGGVGYVVRCGGRTLSRMPPIGDEVLVHVETQVSEQTGTRLYGFLTREDRRAFVLLQSIQGVGPKAALSVLDVLPPAELAAAVAREDKAMVGRAQGVGPKLALRIVVELKGKPLGDGLVAGAHGPAHVAIAAAAPSVAGEATAALMGLAIPEVTARRVVEQAILRLGDDAALPAVIKAALQEMNR